MRMSLICFLSLLYPVAAGAQDSFELAPPLIEYSSVFFDKQAKAEIKFAQSGTSVHYTLSGEEPTMKSLICKGPVLINKNLTVLKAKAFGAGYNPSATTEVTFIKSGLAVKSMTYTLPHSLYPGNGATALMDNKGGNNLLSADTWLGYYCDTVNVAITLERKQIIKSVLVNFLQNESSWVFLPDKIVVDSYDQKLNDYRPVAEETITGDKENPGSNCVYRLLSLKGKTRTDKIMIHFYVKKVIPAWNPAKGSHAWMFIDEIKVY